MKKFTDKNFKKLLKTINEKLQRSKYATDLDDIICDFKFENIEEIQSNDIDRGRRWVLERETIYKLSDRYIMFTADVPKTELQEGCETYAKVFECEPKEVTEIKYILKEN